MKKIKLFLLLTLILMMSTALTGCIKPYDTPEFVTIEASQTAFLVPLIGDTSDQAVFESEALLKETKVATKEVQIPHRWVQTKRRYWKGVWKPTATLIIVDRKPVSRSWESGDSTAASANKAIFGETADGIGIYVGMNCTAMIEEENAAKFLYRYNNTPLATIVDTDIKKMVEDEFNMQTSKYKSTELLDNKANIIESVKNKVITYFEDYGITITVLGLKEGFSYENPNIQIAIDEKFASEQKLEVQQNENAANVAKAESEAREKILLAEAEAEANRLLSESLTPEILAFMYYEKWNGELPYLYGEYEGTLLEIPN